MVSGILNLNKPTGPSSAALVGRVKRLLPRNGPVRLKVGHAGTLDSFASGVLLILVGQATKRCEQLMNAPKQYLATLKLGATTATQDPTSPEQITPHVRPVERDAIERVLRTQVGIIQQRPPAFSALKVGGLRASDRVRLGEAVDLPPRPVQIYGIELVAYDWPTLTLRIDCGRGTYVRSVARDVGEALGVGGYLTALARTRVGDFDIDQAAAPETLTPQTAIDRLRPV